MGELIKNEIERNPQVPALSTESISMLSELCFRHDDHIEEADMIFVFSSPLGNDIIAEIVKGLLKNKMSSEVFLTGGKAIYTESHKNSIFESKLQLDEFDLALYPNIKFFTENKSRNTLENVTEALVIRDFSKYNKIIFIFKAHAAGRGYLTLKKFISPDTILIQKTWAATYSGAEKMITKDNWSTFDFGRSRVWGEFLRIKKYGERGDIFYDEATKALVDKIEKNIKN